MSYEYDDDSDYMHDWIITAEEDGRMMLTDPNALTLSRIGLLPPVTIGQIIDLVELNRP